MTPMRRDRWTGEGGAMAARPLAILVALWCAGYVVVTSTWPVLAGSVVALLLARGGLTRAARRRLSAVLLAAALASLVVGVGGIGLDLPTWPGPGLGLGPVADAWFVVAGLAGLALWARSQPDSFSEKNERIRSTASC